MKKILLIAFSLMIFIESVNAQYSKIFDFERATTGGYPYDAFILHETYLYGTAHLGGTSDDGTVFKIKTDGSDFVKILDFNDAIIGRFPDGSFFYDSVYLYGTTLSGGANSKGTIFKIKPDGSSFVKLFDFDGLNGWGPSGTLISDGSFLYGITKMGGTFGNGTLFKIKPDGSEFLVLMNYKSYSSGSSPNGSLITDGTYLYGMTMSGGITATPLIGGDGTIFKIKTDGTSYTKLLDFTGINGSFPLGSLISDGTFLYGMTRQGGLFGQGNIFKIRPNGNDFTNLLDFNGNINGSVPGGSLIFDGTFLYGMTWGGGTSNYGTIFKIKPDGTSYKKLWEFTSISEGRNPFGSLFFDDTFLYGMTYSGGTNNSGVVFKFDITATVNIKENNANEAVVIFPNPASDHVNIKAPQKSIIELLDLNGQTIKRISHNNDETSVYIGDLASGVYIIKVNNDELIALNRFVKE